MVNRVFSVNDRDLEREAATAFRAVLAGFPDFKTHVRPQSEDLGIDLLIEASGPREAHTFAVQVKSRVTPQLAFAVREQLAEVPKGATSVVYSPVISPRVAEFLRESGIGYLDRAGNCWLRDTRPPLLIERTGFKAERVPTPAAANPFHTKSSRIIRLLLTKPTESWQVRQLATHPDVQVSVGLVVKVKRALIEEGYAVERDRRLFLRDAAALLNAWAERYPGPAEQVLVYLRGDAANAEWTIHSWCVKNHVLHALCGFSAAWRLAPEVRYNVGSLYLDSPAFDADTLDRLLKDCGGKRVETGYTLTICRPFDRSVFAAKAEKPEPMTSPLQTYLDLKKSPGRGEEAATAVFERYMKKEFSKVTEREKERRGSP